MIPRPLGVGASRIAGEPSPFGWTPNWSRSAMACLVGKLNMKTMFAAVLALAAAALAVSGCTPQGSGPTSVNATKAPGDGGGGSGGGSGMGGGY